MKELGVKELKKFLAMPSGKAERSLRLGVLGRAKRQSRANDNTSAGDVSGETIVSNFSNFSNF